MVALDFKGCKVLAISVLPVNKSTLVYGNLLFQHPPSPQQVIERVTSLVLGSSDGGRTVIASDKEVNEKMALLGHTLNLKRHTVGTQNKESVRDVSFV